MTDPVSAAALGAAVKAIDPAATEAAKTASGLLTRLLGPSADVVGADWADRLRQRNLSRLLEKTQKRDGEKTDSGFAAPRLAVATFESAQYADDEIVVEYLSGVLSSSREPDGADDAGVSWSALISRLSSLQLRLHYLIYASVRQSVIELAPERPSAVHGTSVVLSLDDLLATLDMGDRGPERLSDAVDGLMREGLVGGTYAYGPSEFLESQGRKFGNRLELGYEHGFRVELTVHGIRLFLWGTGLGRGMADQYLESDVSIELVDDVAGLKLIKRAGVYSKHWVDDAVVEAQSPE